jgi:hypothetical protein
MSEYTDDKVYKKTKSGRYENIGYDWTGFPSNGFWLVKDGSQNCILRLDDQTTRPVPYLDFARHEDAVWDYITEKQPDGRLSMRDVVKLTLEYLADQVQYEDYV